MLRYKYQGEDKGAEYVESAVEVGMRSLFKETFWKKNLLPIIKEDVEVISGLMEEFALFVNFKFNQMTFTVPRAESDEYFKRIDKNYFSKIYQEMRDGDNDEFSKLRERFSALPAHKTKQRSKI